MRTREMVANGGETGAHLRIPFTEGTTVIVVREMERVVRGRRVREKQV